jgi:hypothetical protein
MLLSPLPPHASSLLSPLPTLGVGAPRSARGGSISQQRHVHARNQSYDGDDEETDLDLLLRSDALDDEQEQQQQQQRLQPPAAEGTAAGTGIVAIATGIRPVVVPSVAPTSSSRLLSVEHLSSSLTSAASAATAAAATSRPSSRLQHLCNSSSSDSSTDTDTASDTSAPDSPATQQQQLQQQHDALLLAGQHPGVGAAARAAALLNSGSLGDVLGSSGGGGRFASPRLLNPLFIGLGEPVPLGFVANAGLDFQSDSSSSEEDEENEAAFAERVNANNNNNGISTAGNEEDEAPAAGTAAASTEAHVPSAPVRTGSSSGHGSRSVRGSSPTTGMPRRLSNSSNRGNTLGRHHEAHSAALHAFSSSSSTSSSKSTAHIAGPSSAASVTVASVAPPPALVHAASVPVSVSSSSCSGNTVSMSAFRSPRGSLISPSTGNGAPGGFTNGVVGRARAVSAHSPLHGHNASPSAAANLASAAALASSPPDPSTPLEPHLYLFSSYPSCAVERLDVARGERLDHPSDYLLNGDDGDSDSDSDEDDEDDAAAGGNTRSFTTANGESHVNGAASKLSASDAVLVLEWAEASLSSKSSLIEEEGAEDDSGPSPLIVAAATLDEDEVAEVRNLRLRALSASSSSPSGGASNHTPRIGVGAGSATAVGLSTPASTRSANGAAAAAAGNEQPSLTSPDTGNSSRTPHTHPPQPFNRLSVTVSSSSASPPAVLSSASTAALSSTRSTTHAVPLSTGGRPTYSNGIGGGGGANGIVTGGHRLRPEGPPLVPDNSSDSGRGSRSGSGSGSGSQLSALPSTRARKRSSGSSKPPQLRPLHVWFGARSAAALSAPSSSASPSAAALDAAARSIALSFLQQRARQSAAAAAVSRGADAESATLEAQSVSDSAVAVDLSAYRVVVEREGQESAQFREAFCAKDLGRSS